MDILEIFIGGFIANIIGKYTRYLFFFFIGRKKSIKSLSGNSKDDISNFSQNFYNTLIGLIVFVSLAVAIVKLIDSIRFHSFS